MSATVARLALQSETRGSLRWALMLWQLGGVSVYAPRVGASDPASSVPVRMHALLACTCPRLAAPSGFERRRSARVREAAADSPALQASCRGHARGASVNCCSIESGRRRLGFSLQDTWQTVREGLR
jgi:hypothetical protein